MQPGNTTPIPQPSAVTSTDDLGRTYPLSEYSERDLLYYVLGETPEEVISYN
jgi:hypothetical protein